MTRSLVSSGLTRVDSRLDRDSSIEAAKHGLFQVPLPPSPSPLSSSKGSKAWNARLGPGRPMQTGRELVKTESEQGLSSPETLGIGPAPAGLDAPPISPGHQDIPGTPCQPCGTLIGGGLGAVLECLLVAVATEETAAAAPAPPSSHLTPSLEGDPEFVHSRLPSERWGDDATLNRRSEQKSQKRL